KVEQQVLVPQIQVIPRPADLATFGLTAGEVRRQAQTLIAGQKLGEIYRDQKAFDVALWGEPAVRSDLHALADLMIQAPTGAPVRLRDVADVRIMPAPNEVKRENGQRRIDVTLNIAGADLGGVARAVEAAVAQVPFATGYSPRVLGEYAALQESRQRLWSTGLLCLVGILLLVWLEFRSGRITALVALSLPFALVGGVIGVALTGGVLYGIQCLCHWADMAGFIRLGTTGHLINGILPTVLFLIAVGIVMWRDRHKTQTGVATRALNAAFGGVGLTNLFMNFV
ncbi:MAG: hypothetical protein B7Z26_09305, partial [Asticcacaulis sp. 32-58-5]